MNNQRAAILARYGDFLDSSIRKAGLNFASTERLSGKLLGKNGAHGAEIVFISKTTLHEHARGRRRNLAPWDWTANLWAVVVAAATERRKPLGEIGGLEEWRNIHAATEAELRQVSRLAQTATSTLQTVTTTPAMETRTTWWRDYGDVVPPWFEQYLNSEPLANHVRCYEEQYVPGLLQVPGYAQDVIRLEYGQASEEEIKRRVELRMQRQVLMPYQGRRVWSLINEKALREPPVGRAVMKRQLAHLLNLPRNMPIQVVPEDAPVCQSVVGPITLLRFDHSHLRDMIYLEQADSALYPDETEIRALYLAQFNGLAVAAYRPKASRNLIERLFNEM